MMVSEELNIQENINQDSERGERERESKFFIFETGVQLWKEVGGGALIFLKQIRTIRLLPPLLN